MNILLTSVGRRSYLVEYFRKALKEDDRIIVSNANAMTTAMQMADKSYVSPIIYDKEYIPFIKDICKKENIDILLSLFDIDLPVLSAHKEEFKELGVRMIISDKSIVDICNDKLRMCEYLKDRGFYIPDTYTDISDENVKKSISASHPYMVKPRWGMGSIGIYQAEDFKELDIFYKRVNKDISSSYLRFESAADIDRAVLIQEKIEGIEYGLDIINDLEGNYINTVVKEKIAMRAGETDIARVIDYPLLKELGKCISKNLHHIANLDMDVIVKDERAYIIDMNVRFGGGYPFTHMAGVNLVKAIIKWSMNEKLEKDFFEPIYNEVYAKNIGMMKI